VLGHDQDRFCVALFAFEEYLRAMPATARIATEYLVDMNILVTDHDMQSIRLVFRSVEDFYLDVMEVVALACWAFQFCAEAFVILIKGRLHLLSRFEVRRNGLVGKLSPALTLACSR